MAFASPSPLIIDVSRLVGRTPNGGNAMTIWDLQVRRAALGGASPPASSPEHARHAARPAPPRPAPPPPQNLLLHLLLGAPKPSWLCSHANDTPGPVVLALMPGVSAASWRAAAAAAEQAGGGGIFSQVVPLSAHGTDKASGTVFPNAATNTLATLLAVSERTAAAAAAAATPSAAALAAGKRKRPDGGSSPQQRSDGGGNSGGSSEYVVAAAAASVEQDPLPKWIFRASERQLALAGFPAPPPPGAPIPPGWASTSTRLAEAPVGALSEAQWQEVAALDVECCRTAAGLEPVRVTLLDGRGSLLLDEMLLPENPILDMLTEHHGAALGYHAYRTLPPPLQPGTAA